MRDRNRDNQIVRLWKVEFTTALHLAWKRQLLPISEIAQKCSRSYFKFTLFLRKAMSGHLPPISIEHSHKN